MKAAVYNGPGRRLALETVADPTPADDEVVLQVLRSGICGSDLHMAALGFSAPGTIFGHEFSGAVVARGKNVSADVAVGTIVTANPWDSCRTCDMCGQGHAAMCHAGVCLGVGPEKPGAYAEYVAVKAHGLHRLPAGVSLEEGALVEPLAVAYHAVRLAALSRDDEVLVMGGGPIGAAVTLLARQAGVRNVVMSEPNAVRRDYAKNFGASAVIDPHTGDLGALASKHFDGRLPSVVIECVGNPGRINDALGAVRQKGRVIIPGVCMQEDRFMPVVGIMKELSLQFSQTSTDSDFAAVLNLIAKKDIEAEKLHTRTISLADVGEVFESLAGDPTQVKVMIAPGEKS